MTTSSESVYEAIINSYRAGETSMLVTVVHKEGSGPAVLGAKMLIRPQSAQIGTVGGGALENLAINECKRLLETGESVLKSYSLNEEHVVEGHLPTGMLCGGEVSLFFEHLSPGHWIFIFGGGHIGQAVLHHLSRGAWSVVLIDPRPEMTENVSEAVRVHSVPPVDFIKDNPLPASSSFVITTHSHDLDYQIALALFQADINPRYMGLIASSRKAEIFIRDLAEDLSEDTDFSMLYTPIGLDIGGNTPDEIALSIVSQLQAVKHQRPGSHLRIQSHQK